jgi:ketosteroid isomerase-like protein
MVVPAVRELTEEAWMGRLLCVFVLCVVAQGASAQGEAETEPAAPPAEAEAAEADATSPVREAVDAGNYFFMKHFEARDAQAIADLYTEDARVIAPGAVPAEGRAAIAAFWAAAMEGTKSARLETLSVESAGELAFEEGVVLLTANDGRQSAERYVVVWKRVGRRWHLHRDIWNAGPSERAATPEAEAPTADEPEPAGPEADEAPVVPEQPL